MSNCSNGIEDLLEDLIRNHYLEGAALGIAKQAVDQGYDSLTEKQAYVLKRDALNHYPPRDCNRCQTQIRWGEVYESQSNGGYCSYCAYQRSKGN